MWPGRRRTYLYARIKWAIEVVKITKLAPSASTLNWFNWKLECCDCDALHVTVDVIKA
jgi:hypothetical protein